MKKIKSIMGLIFFAFSLMACADHQAVNKSESWLAYEPSEVVLKGHLEWIEKYGSPNFGESPETDQKVQVSVLKLASPIQIKGDPNSATNQETLTDIKEVQVVCLAKALNCSSFKNKNVMLKGTLSHAISGHHYTPAVFNVKTIQAY